MDSNVICGKSLDETFMPLFHFVHTVLYGSVFLEPVTEELCASRCIFQRDLPSKTRMLWNGELLSWETELENPIIVFAKSETI
jgi:hypothetical protein